MKPRASVPAIDGRCALLALLASILVTVLCPPRHWLRLELEAALILLVLAGTRAPVRWLLRRLLLLAPFLLLALASVPFMRTGSSDLSPALRAASAAVRALVSFGALAAALHVSSANELLEGLSRLRVPPIFVTLMSLMLRYLALLEEETFRMLRARDARGMPPTIRARAAVAGAIVGSLFVRSFERSERVSQAMQARGFDGLLPAPAPRPIPSRDLLLLTGWALLQLSLAFL